MAGRIRCFPRPASINYFNALVAADTSGGTGQPQGPVKTQQYARLFMAPGMWHC